MSANDNEPDMCCAACGIKQLDDIKLKKCTACYLVSYCSVQCQKNHRKQHKKECKQRMAELREELLFKQPESSHFGDCPICCLPLAITEDKSSMTSCCCVLICDGCAFTNQMKDERSVMNPLCPYCREPYVETAAEAERNIRKRIKAGDPKAIRNKGVEAKMVQNYGVALELLTKASKLGDIVAHHLLGNMYAIGEGVEIDKKKGVYHWEEAAIGGHPDARYNLGATNAQQCKFEKAIKHFMIAASLGHDKAVETLKEWYGFGTVTKADFATALRAHQAFVNSTKSPEREAAAKAESARSVLQRRR